MFSLSRVMYAIIFRRTNQYATKTHCSKPVLVYHSNIIETHKFGLERRMVIEVSPKTLFCPAIKD
jgi:hypothetical protein